MNISDKYFFVNHKYRDTMYVPYVAIRDNITFLCDMKNEERYVVTSDAVRAFVVSCKEIHICDLENAIQANYGISAWQFLCTWHRAYPNMDAMHFVELKLRKL